MTLAPAERQRSTVISIVSFFFSPPGFTTTNCTIYRTCAECIVGNPECSWCEDSVSLSFNLYLVLIRVDYPNFPGDSCNCSIEFDSISQLVEQLWSKLKASMEFKVESRELMKILTVGWENVCFLTVAEIREIYTDCGTVGLNISLFRYKWF